ncbi:hypothetical protein EAF00_000150 [Botryotinia globosa]|nr:hypothetical protein EAF00_000150 [Botryotinia globosa]
MGPKNPPGVPNSFFGPGGPAVPSPAAPSAPGISAADQAAADRAAADLLEKQLEKDMEREDKAVRDALAKAKAAANKTTGKPPPEPVSPAGSQDSEGDEPGQKTAVPWEDAPPLVDDAVAVAARIAPPELRFPDVARANLLPLMGAGIHPVSTSSAGNLCGLHALVYSYSALRDLAAPEGTPVPLADNPTAKDLQLYKTGPQFYKDVMEFLTSQGILVFMDDKGNPLNERQVMRQVTGIVPNSAQNYDINVLQAVLLHLNRTYGTHYVIGHILHGFNVRWDPINKVWDTAYRSPTAAQAFGEGVHPILWLYNDNYENEIRSLHQSESDDPMGHWMGFSTLHRNLDEGLIEEGNSWFEHDIDAYLNEGVWIVTADVEGYHVDLEEHQDPRELRLYTGNFVRVPTVIPDGDVPDGYMWVQGSTIYVGDVETPGPIGIAPLKCLKKIAKNFLREAHDAAGATAANIIRRVGIVSDDKGKWQEFVVHRTIEPTTKIHARYANPNDPAKKFVGGFIFEDGEFLLDTQEPLKDLYPRMIRMDGTRGRVKPRNLQFLEKAWKLPETLPVAVSGTKKIPTTSMTPGKQILLTSSNKSDPKYRYRPTMKAADFKIKDLRIHCKARGMVPKDYGKTKASMLAKLVEHDEKNNIAVQPAGGQVPKPAESGNFLPMRRVLVDIAKQAGPPKMPPFFATEIVVELGKGDADDPATWIIDYEGRVGRIDDDNLEPIDGAWGIELDPVRWTQIIGDLRKDLGYNKPPKPAAKLPASPAAKPPAKPPASPAAKPPAKPPASTAAKPPAKTTSKTPAKPPASPAAKPPVEPLVKPPAKTPSKPPAKPPASPAAKPVEPPAKTTSKTPAKPPASPAAKPPVEPLVKPPAKTPAKTPAKPAANPAANPATKPAGKKVAFEIPPPPGSAASGVPPPNPTAGKTVGKRPASSSAEPANKKTKKKK